MWLKKKWKLTIACILLLQFVSSCLNVSITSTIGHGINEDFQFDVSCIKLLQANYSVLNIVHL
jgi:hypothetical protein